MKKSDLVVALAKNENLTEKESQAIIDIVFDGFTRTLKQGGRIETRGFGAFRVRTYGSYKGRNPKTGEQIEVKGERNAYFKEGKDLMERIN